MLEFMKEEYDEENKSSIILPEGSKDKIVGKGNSLISPHYFKVTDIGPKCKFVKKGDRIFPKPPSYQVPAAFQACLVWINGKREERYIISESNIAGIE
jgi:hypothetical protein